MAENNNSKPVPGETSIQDQLTFIINQLASFKEEQQSFRQEHQQYMNEQQTFRNETTSTLSTLTNEVNSISGTLIEQQESIAKLESEVAGLDQAVGSQEKDIGKLNKGYLKSDVRIKILEGKLKHQEIVIKEMQEQITNIKAKQVNKNVIITQVAEDENETQLQTRAKVVSFMKDQMKMTDNDIEKVKFDDVHRTGRKGPKPRRIRARMSDDTDPKDFYKFKRNINFDVNQVFQEFPPEINETRRVLQVAMETEKASVPAMEKRLIGDKLYVKGKQYTPIELQKTSAPAPYNEADIDWVDAAPRVYISDTKSKDGNHFKAYAARINSREEAQAIKDLVMAEQRSNPSTHLTCAYRLSSLRYKDDDREHGAGAKILKVLDETNTNGVIILVARWFSGIELGPDRFKFYTDVAKKALHILLHRA